MERKRLVIFYLLVFFFLPLQCGFYFREANLPYNFGGLGLDAPIFNLLGLINWIVGKSYVLIPFLTVVALYIVIGINFIVGSVFEMAAGIAAAISPGHEAVYRQEYTYAIVWLLMNHFIKAGVIVYTVMWFRKLYGKILSSRFSENTTTGKVSKTIAFSFNLLLATFIYYIALAVVMYLFPSLEFHGCSF